MNIAGEVVAVMPDVDGDTTIVLRNPDGGMSVRTVSPDSTLAQKLLGMNGMRKSKPIIDPVSRQVVGYEMEPLTAAVSMR